MLKVIKSGDASRVVEPYELEQDLQEQAMQLRLAQAKAGGNYTLDAVGSALQQSDEILIAARNEAERIREEARREGYEEGLRQGRETGRQEAYQENMDNMEADRQEIKAMVIAAISEVEAQKQKILDKYLVDLKDISVAVAEKVIKVSLKNSGDIIKRMIIAATEKLKKTQWAKIYISKYDAELMLEGDASLLNSLSYLSDNIKIITMDKEQSGTCIIELPKEIIDVSVDTQLENIKEILNNAHL